MSISHFLCDLVHCPVAGAEFRRRGRRRHSHFPTENDRSRLLVAMGTLTGEQRCYVGMKYKEMFDKDLRDLMKSECGKKDFGYGLQLLALPPDAVDVSLIRKAAKGAGTNERLLHTIICGRSNKDMEVLKKTFFNLITEDLGRVLDRELGGSMEDLVRLLTRVLLVVATSLKISCVSLSRYLSRLHV